MRLAVDLGPLVNVRESIGAPMANVKLSKAPPKPRTRVERELVEGGSVVITDAETNEVSSTAGLLAIGDTQITLHIYLPHVGREDLLSTMAPNPKYHFSGNCPTLETMMRDGKYNRYVATHNPDGTFRVKPKDLETGRWEDEEVLSAIPPCKNCLKDLNYQGYEQSTRSGKATIFSEFSLDRFFSECQSIFRCMPLYTPETFPGPNYTNDFAKISLNLRAKKKWICECCEGDFSDSREVLHTHHIDGNRGNNRPTNLKALCIVCHANQPLHGHMTLSRDDLRKVESSRRKAGKKTKCSGCENRVVPPF